MSDNNFLKKNYILCNGFWPGFAENTDANTFSFFNDIFKECKFNNFELTTDLNKATILFESLFGQSLLDFKKWDLTIHYSGEPFTTKKIYDIYLDSEFNDLKKKYVNIPLCVYYIFNKKCIDIFLNNFKLKTFNNIPKKFCCFIVSNPKSLIRNKVFFELNKYKKIDSFGSYCNNMGKTLHINYWSSDFINFLSEYKFVLCFENTKKGSYVTEKIVNPLLANIIPLYWGSEHVKHIFNDKSFLYLENETDESINKFIDLITKIDNNDNDYLEIVNSPKMTLSNINYYKNNYTINNIANNINKII